jgi:hypothetical protein
MQEIKVYDSNRKPVSWMEIIQPHQYALFHQHSRMGTPLTSDGQPLTNELNGTCLIFDSLAEAEEYARNKVAQSPLIACHIFDSAGKANEQSILLLLSLSAVVLPALPGLIKISTGAHSSLFLA